MITFRTAFYRLVPKWLSSGDGEKVLYSVGLVLDAFAERARLGVLARFPTYAPPDALAALGRDRGFFRGLQDTDASYAERMRPHLDFWPRVGSGFPILEQLQAYLGEPTRVRIVTNHSTWYTIEADGSRSEDQQLEGDWDWDGNTTGAPYWQRFWVIIYPPPELWIPLDPYGSLPPYGEIDGTWGSTATAEQVQTVREIVRKYKPAHARCVNIIVSFDPDLFDPSEDPTSPPDGDWGNLWRTDAGVRRANRSRDAIYWDGVT